MSLAAATRACSRRGVTPVPRRPRFALRYRACMESPRPSRALPAQPARWRDVLVQAGLPVVALLVLGLAGLPWAAWQVLDPTPDKRLVIAMGPEGSAYDTIAQRYLPLLQAQGLQLELHHSAGATQNLARLADPASGVQVSFAQGGVAAPGDGNDSRNDSSNSGPPWLQRYLPFWLANFGDRMWIVLLPLLAALVPLSRIVPPLVTLRLRSRVYRWYAHLRAVEQALEHPRADLVQLRAELERIDTQTEHIGLPLAFTNELYDLRAHIHLVRKRLMARAAGAAAEPLQPAAS